MIFYSLKIDNSILQYMSIESIWHEFRHHHNAGPFIGPWIADDIDDEYYQNLPWTFDDESHVWIHMSYIERDIDDLCETPLQRESALRLINGIVDDFEIPLEDGRVIQVKNIEKHTFEEYCDAWDQFKLENP